MENSTYYNIGLQFIEACVDIEYLSWLIWLFTPVVVTFLLPLVIIFLLYLSALFLYLYRYRHRLKDAYSRDFWNGARNTIATLWGAHGWIWHGYEVDGFENIPDSSPALLVYYHGAIPIDYYYLMSKCFVEKQRLIRAVGDQFLFRIPGYVLTSYLNSKPTEFYQWFCWLHISYNSKIKHRKGWNILLEVLKVSPGSIQSCVQTLEEGHLLSISPGGVLEAQFSDENYHLLWGKRIGFAKVALKAKVPVIPIFTKNVRESFRSISIGRRLFRKVYDKLRLPVVPVYGGFPVKLTTIIGKPIPFDPNLTPEELARKTAEAIQNLIKTHQKIPGSILRALFERIYEKRKNI
ncbi:transmembrane protein 68-like isoform X2 [Centruroides sculpturatus]|nr:transmembrane protein 68-like isoform X2 [Centruroides sculpturatus]XP_023222685.1 transmembrane protein 68-like isoform X2 [Centruroides sculpturatus]XP_023222686.1 transmembrane protein 68-like isoform X2 [Centruroides sculpturatus]